MKATVREMTAEEQHVYDTRIKPRETPQPKWKTTNWLRHATDNPEAWRSGYESGRMDAVNALLTYVRHSEDCTFWKPADCGCPGCTCGLTPALAAR